MVNTEIRLIIFFASKDGEALYSQQKNRPGANCGSHHQLLIAKFRLNLKKVGKTNRPARYDLNQIPYEYTVEVMNRFKGLDLLNRVPEELWFIILYRRQQTKPSQRKRNTRRQSGCLTRLYNTEERREVKSKGEKESYTQLNAVSGNSKERQKGLLP